MSEQLDQIFNLIKAGQKQEAIAQLEPLIRADRDNEDAWWMLANATEDPAAKRNALNNVLRLTSNETRKTNAETLLTQLDDSYGFDIDVPAPGKLSAYQELDEVPKKKSSAGLSCATISLIFVAIIGVCACAGIFALMPAIGGIMDALTYPDDYRNMGFMEDDADEKVKTWLGGKADVVMSDMAASSSGHKQTDHLRIMALCETAAYFAFDVLEEGGTFVAKVLAGGAEGDLQKLLKQKFKNVAHMKPPSSRADSSEKFVIATGFRG